MSFVTLGQDPSHSPPLNLPTFLQCPSWMAKYTQESDVFEHELVEIEHLNRGDQPARVVDISDVRKQLQKQKQKQRKRKRHCSTCGFTSKEKAEFQIHKKKHPKKKEFAPREKAINPVIRKYACESCSYKASQKIQLNVHLTLVHSVENLVKNIFQCKECPRRLLSSHKLEDHMKLHSPPTLPCQHCGKMFHTDEHLSKHKYAVHVPDDEKQVRCNECGKGFISESRMREHMNIHLGVKPHMCPHCGKHLSNLSNLQAHTRKLHPEHFKEGTKKSVRVMS